MLQFQPIYLPRGLVRDFFPNPSKSVLPRKRHISSTFLPARAYSPECPATTYPSVFRSLSSLLFLISDSETTEDETTEPQMETKEGPGRSQDKAGRRGPSGIFKKQKKNLDVSAFVLFTFINYYHPKHYFEKFCLKYRIYSFNSPLHFSNDVACDLLQCLFCCQKHTPTKLFPIDLVEVTLILAWDECVMKFDNPLGCDASVTQCPSLSQVWIWLWGSIGNVKLRQNKKK